MSYLYSATILLSSALLFLVQPMFARLLLPRLGGSPAVWNTCVLFFQATLLAGYAYAHLGPTRLGLRPHAWLHLLLMLAAATALPLSLPASWSPPTDHTPVLALLLLLTASVGLPAFVISAHGPLLQHWFARSRTGGVRDPYWLYIASNAGSMAALVGYPLLVEPAFALTTQTRLWSIGFLALAGLLAACAFTLPAGVGTDEKASTRPSSAISGQARAQWVVAAFVPSSLLLSVTQHLTTDVAPVPLLWIAPLAIYLLSFILVFADRPWISLLAMIRVLPLAVVVLALVILSEATEPVWLLVVLHLSGLFVVAMVCHGILAAARPAPDRLTEFYLWLSLGGVLGGVFNTLLAPLVFPSLLEYPLMLIAVSLIPLLLGTRSSEAIGVRDLAWAVGLAAGILAAGLLVPFDGYPRLMALASVGAIVCYTFKGRPWRFALGIAGLLAACGLFAGVHGRTLCRVRSFYGIHRVVSDGTDHLLVHGNTVHGRQSQEPARHREPLAYYHRTGPLGEVFRTLVQSRPAANIAVVGLGAGAIAAYGQPGQTYTFYEIDPNVDRLARDPRFFTYIEDSPARIDTILGDARLTLTQTDRGPFDLIVLDAFSSDAIPLHLLTREALQIYRDRLQRDGVLAFHISNRYLNLEPVLAALSADAKLVCWGRYDPASPLEIARGKSASHWVAMSPKAEVLAPLERLQWTRPQPKGAVPWTDDYCNLLQALADD
ncbi:MAG TPA: fused MFS/spermidine synthase [Planctomycetaceae bacterium]|nr:fused MFS/spermidine synthase [Planctomycetaceae bacterium]